MAYTVNDIDGGVMKSRYPQRVSDRGIGLAEILEMLGRRWIIIAFTTAIVLGAAALFILLAPTLYSASTQVLVDPRDRRILGTEVMSSTTGSDPTLVESQLRIITSDAVLGRVVSTLNLGDDAEFASGGQRGEGAAMHAARAIASLRRHVTVTRAERTYVIDIAVSAHSADKAKALADAIANAYLADQADANKEMTQRATEALTSRLTQLRENLRSAESKALDYRKEHGLVLTQGVLVSEQEIADLNRRLVEAHVRTADAQARYDQIRANAGSGGVSEALGSGVVTSLRAQLAEITRREAELSQTLGDRNPALIEVRAQLANTRRLIGQETARISEASANELAIARENERSLTRQFKDLTGQTESDNASLIELRDLERDSDAARKLYEAFLTRAKQTAEQEQIATPGARILAPAALPLSASYPPAFLVLLIALVAGIGLGAVIALMRDQMDSRV